MVSKFKLLRIVKDMIQAELAQKPGIQQIRISLFEREIARPTKKELEQLSKILGKKFMSRTKT